MILLALFSHENRIPYKLTYFITLSSKILDVEHVVDQDQETGKGEEIKV
jgi:hypothetical protein